MKSILILFNDEFNKYKKSLIYWSIGLVLMMLLYMGLFNSVKELASDKLDMMPDALLSLFNISSFSNMLDYNYYFTMIFGMVVLVLSVYGCVFASKLLQGEETSLTIEFLYVNPIKRSQIFISKLFFCISYFLILYLLVLLTGVIVGLIVASDINVGAIVSSSVHGFLCIVLYLIVSFAFSASFKKHINAMFVSVIVFISTYFLGFLSTFELSFLEYLKYISPLNFLSSETFLDIYLNKTTYDFAGIIITFIVSVLCIVISFKIYKKRDII